MNAYARAVNPILRALRGSALAKQSHRGFVRTSLLLETITVKVPSMGDSITEGTIVEWTASEGQMVKEGDVIALVETDKVTVDIKADIDGVIVARYGAVDDTIEVGADLYQIDTEAEGIVVTSDSSSESPETTSAVPEPVAAPTATEVNGDAHSERNPSIHFLGKEGWSKRLSGAAEEVTTSVPMQPSNPTSTISLDGSFIGPNYGRPIFSEEEMEAILTGGANLAPEVLAQSGGAKFG